MLSFLLAANLGTTSAQSCAMLRDADCAMPQSGGKWLGTKDNLGQCAEAVRADSSCLSTHTKYADGPNGDKNCWCFPPGSFPPTQCRYYNFGGSVRTYLADCSDQGNPSNSNCPTPSDPRWAGPGRYCLGTDYRYLYTCTGPSIPGTNPQDCYATSPPGVCIDAPPGTPDYCKPSGFECTRIGADCTNVPLVKWLGETATQGECASKVKQDSACNNGWFKYAQDGDKNCGCVQPGRSPEFCQFSDTGLGISTYYTDCNNVPPEEPCDGNVPCPLTIYKKQNCNGSPENKWLGAKLNDVACLQAVQLDDECNDNFFKYAILGDRNCGCMKKDSTITQCTFVDDGFGVWTYQANSLPTIKVYKNQNCQSDKEMAWLGARGTAAQCAQTIQGSLSTSTPCDQQYFQYSPNDKNCGCFKPDIDPATDCNFVSNNDITTYEITSLIPV